MYIPMDQLYRPHHQHVSPRVALRNLVSHIRSFSRRSSAKACQAPKTGAMETHGRGIWIAESTGVGGVDSERG
jgi:hypothetical protein